MISLLRRAVIMALLVVPRAAYADFPLTGCAVAPVVHVHPGTTVTLFARLQNPTDQVIFIRGISHSSSETFTGQVSLAAFLAAPPDSLRPGDQWEGALAQVVGPSGTPTSASHRLDFHLSGGAHPAANELIAQISFTLDDSTATTAVPVAGAVPMQLSISINPNPGSGPGRIALVLPTAQDIDLRVFDLLGRMRRVIANGRWTEGRHDIEWNTTDESGRPLPAGIYLLRLSSASGVRRIRWVCVR